MQIIGLVVVRSAGLGLMSMICRSVVLLGLMYKPPPNLTSLLAIKYRKSPKFQVRVKASLAHREAFRHIF